MIVVTGAAGFIGSVLVSALNSRGYKDIVAVDDFGRLDKNRNLVKKSTHLMIHRDDFPDWLEVNASAVEFVFHLGARTDTAETDEDLFDKLNYHYSQKVWKICTEFHLPLNTGQRSGAHRGSIRSCH